MTRAGKAFSIVLVLCITMTTAACDKDKFLSLFDTKGDAKKSGAAEGASGPLGTALNSLYSRNYANALEAAERAKALEPTNAAVLFVLTQSYAVNGKKVEAIKTLDDALRGGFGNRDVLASDPYLRDLRESQEFQELMKKYGIEHQKAETTVKAGRVEISEDVIKAGNIEIRTK
jgi:hypothetical protein